MMKIDFKGDRFKTVSSSYNEWWNGVSDRAITPVLYSKSALGTASYTPLSFLTAYDETISVKEFIRAENERLASLGYAGDAFPCMRMNYFGPGVVAAFLGCVPEPRKSTVWFKPPEKLAGASDIHFEFDVNNKWLRRVASVYEAGMDFWRGECVIQMTDLGGSLDILASFLGTEKLLTELIDNPGEVIRCLEELDALWVRYFEYFNNIIGESNGFSDWFGMYYDKPGYILQSDFSYMISNRMFREFTLPSLKRCAAGMNRAVYHLDGVGQLNHLDTLLGCGFISGIQWVPGSGENSEPDWSEVLQRTAKAGLKVLSLPKRNSGEPHSSLPEAKFIYNYPISLGSESEAREFCLRNGIHFR